MVGNCWETKIRKMEEGNPRQLLQTLWVGGGGIKNQKSKVKNQNSKAETLRKLSFFFLCGEKIKCFPKKSPPFTNRNIKKGAP